MYRKKQINALIFGTLTMLLIGVNPTWSVFSNALVTQYGWTYSQATLPYTISGFGYSAGVFLFGIYYHKRGPKKTVLIGGLMTGASLVLSSYFFSPIPVAFLYGVLYGMGVGAAYTAAITPMLKWTPGKKRSMASAFATIGFGLSSVFLSILFSKMIPVLMVPATLRIAGFVLGPLVMVMTFFVKDPPEEFLLANEPAPEADGETRAGDISLKGALRTKTFYLLFLLFVFATAATSVILSSVSNIVAMQSDVPDPFVFASLATIGNLAGRLIAGYLGTKFDGRKILAILFALLSAIMFTFCLYRHFFPLAAGTVLLAAGFGAEMTLFPILITDNFGVTWYSEIYGTIVGLGSIYTLAGPTLAGKIADLTGSYTPALLMCGGYLAVAVIMMLLLPKKKH
ncbi:MAG: MFS transporter [Lachnospiraceae bacterium]|nr:MFS transporter [Lachnospiraceae bacterium]